MSFKRIVSVGAHSLDAEILGGALMYRYAKTGAHCTFIHVTSGRLEDPKATEEAKKKYLVALKKQNEEAAKTLDCDCYRLGYISSNMPSEEEFAKRMEKYFLDEKVDLVITHWRGSMHPRHIATHRAVRLACKRIREKGGNIKLLYGETFEDLVGYVPQAYFKLTLAEKNKWLEALKKYQVFNGEVNDFPYIPYYENISKIRQIEANCDTYVTCFMYASLIENNLW